MAIQRNEVGGVDMRLRENYDESSPEISQAYLGDVVYMFIKYTGSKFLFIIKINPPAATFSSI